MVAVGDTSTGSWTGSGKLGVIVVGAPGKVPNDLGLNVGGPSTGFSTGLRKLEDRHSVNTGDSSKVSLSPECLGG